MKLKNGLGLVQKKSKLLRFKIDHYLPYLRPHVQLLNNSWRNIFRLQHRNPSVSDLELHFPKGERVSVLGNFGGPIIFKTAKYRLYRNGITLTFSELRSRSFAIC